MSYKCEQFSAIVYIHRAVTIRHKNPEHILERVAREDAKEDTDEEEEDDKPVKRYNYDGGIYIYIFSKRGTLKKCSGEEDALTLKREEKQKLVSEAGDLLRGEKAERRFREELKLKSEKANKV